MVWQYNNLGALAEFRNGINFSIANRGKGIKVISVADFQDYLIPKYDQLREINPEGVVRPEDLLKENDIIFVRSNGNRDLIGRSLYIKNLQERVTHSGFTIRLRFTHPNTFAPFFIHLLKSEFVRIELSHFGSGTNISNLSQETLRKVRVPLPPLPEQRKIAEILSTWDEAIALTEWVIASKQQLKKGLMQQLLSGKKRFPEFGGKEWHTFQLGDVFSERTETGYENFPLLSITDDGITYRDDLARRDTSSDDKSKYLRICPGDIGYNTMRMWQGRSALSKFEGIVSPAYTILIPSDSISARFMAYFFKYPPIIHKFFRYSQGLVSDTLSLKYQIFSKIQVKIPDLSEQEKIADLLELCDNEISLFKQKSKALQQQKKGLMQKLLTGEVRVKI
jgi:type I restriction enzyme S subunit